MKWKKWPFIAGLTGAILSGILWVILQKNRNTQASHSKQAGDLQHQTNIQPEATVPPDSSKQPIDNSKKQLPNPTLPIRPKRSRIIAGPIFLISHKSRILAILLMLFSLLLFLAWSIALFINLLREPLPADFQNDQTVPTIDNPLLPPDGVSILPKGRLGSNEPHATLTLTISQIKNINPSEATMTGIFVLSIPRELQTKICDSTGLTIEQEMSEDKCQGKGLVAQQTKSQGLQLKPQYVSKSLSLSIYDLFGPDTYSKAIPLKDLFLPPPSSNILNTPNTSDTAVELQVPVTFTLLSQGETYPDDKYWGGAGVSVSMPSPLYVLNEVLYTPSNYLPIDTRVRASSGIGNMEVNVTQIKSNYPADIDALNIDAHRAPFFEILIYFTTIFIPLGFLTFIGHSLFSSRESDKDPLQNILLNAFIAILTVVAIRQVLVPPDIQGMLTRLDLILAVAATLLIGLIFTRYAFEIWKTSKKNYYD